MEWLNYHHLHYFWVVATEGGIGKASKRLRLSQPALSTQIGQLEKSLGRPLFTRQGRGLVLTDFGQSVLKYADRIFQLGAELLDMAHDRPVAEPVRVSVGVTDVVPKAIAHRVLSPLLKDFSSYRLICREGSSAELLARLAVHDLDLVVCDRTIPPEIGVRGRHHLLARSGITFLAHPRLAARLKGRFPKNLDGAPFLMPGKSSHLNASLRDYFDDIKIRPMTVAEVDDGALTKSLARQGLGVCAAPALVADEIATLYGIRAIGQTRKITESYFAITMERVISNPGVELLLNSFQRSS